MPKKYPKHIERRAMLHAIDPVDGWVLITREETNHETGAKRGPWHIAWLEIFGSKKGALAFANANGWPRPYQAVRASLALTL